MTPVRTFDADDQRMKLDRVREWLARAGLDEAWLLTTNNIGWLFGSDTLIDRSKRAGIAAVNIHAEELLAVTSNIEAQRLRDEELPDTVTVESFDWYRKDLQQVITERAGSAAAADVAIPGFATIDSTALRLPPTDRDIERFRSLASRTAAGLEATCRELEADWTEQRAAVELQHQLGERGVEAPVALVGSSERAPAYRHFTPKAKKLGAYAIVSVTSRSDGLSCSATRTVAFDPPTWLEPHHEAAMRVDATASYATQQELGRGTAGDVFSAIQHAYETVGFPNEWQLHHQGGAAGYDGREWVASPASTAPVTDPMVVSWNPTVQGAKSEDTVLVTADRVEVLTTTGEWPVTSVEPIGFDGSIDRHQIVSLD